MIRTRTHKQPSQNHTKRPFFSKGSRLRETAPFFSTHRADVIQRMGETTQLPEEEESQVQMQAAENTLQRETMLDEEEEVAQPKALTETPIQRMCDECEREQQQKSTLQPKLTVGQPNDKYEQEADRVAEEVVNQLQPPNSAPVQGKFESNRPGITPLVMRQGEGATAVSPQVDQGIQRTRGGGQAIAQPILGSMEQAFGTDFSGVRIHANSESERLNRSLNARGFTTGQDIYFKRGEYQPESQTGQKLLAHELTHVVQQSGADESRLEQNSEVELGQQKHLPQPPLVKSRLGDSPGQLVQREVRINGGRTRVNEANYLPGGSRSRVGSQVLIRDLIGDNVRRVFNDVTELELYADGLTDYIGDVVTGAAGTFWYRLPEDQLTVLGEFHSNPLGNVEDVILGLQTSRFMYEPFHEFTEVEPFREYEIGGGTESRLEQIEQQERVGGLINRTHFAPHMENIVIKGLTGATLTRNVFIAGSPATMNSRDRQLWSGRPTVNDYSLGERTALYLSMAIHIASDISQYNFQPVTESHYIESARRLTEFYLANQPVLDQFMTIKDADDLIGIYEITHAEGFAHLPILRDFCPVFQEYASRYIEQLGVQTVNPTLESEGQALPGNLQTLPTSLPSRPGASEAAIARVFSMVDPAREEIMWARVQHARANDYLIAGMGNAHRRNLRPRLDTAGIRHEEVAQSLSAQKTTINSHWVP